MDMLQKIFVEPFVDMVAAPDFLMQVIWEGLVSGVLYALIALGFVLIFRSSRIFNFAQGIMVVFAALTLVGLHAMGIPAWVSVALTLVVMFILAVAIERIVLRPLVGQPDIILFMATIGITLFLIGTGETIFGGENKVMITRELGIPTGDFGLERSGASCCCNIWTSPWWWWRACWSARCWCFWARPRWAARSARWAMTTKRR